MLHTKLTNLQVLFTLFSCRCTGVLNDVYMFDSSLVVWTELSDKAKGRLPVPRAGAGLVSNNKRLFLFGGWNGQG